MCEAETATNRADGSGSDGEEQDHADVGYARGDEARSPLSYALVIVRGVRAAQRKPATQRAR